MIGQVIVWFLDWLTDTLVIIGSLAFLWSLTTL